MSSVIFECAILPKGKKGIATKLPDGSYEQVIGGLNAKSGNGGYYKAEGAMDLFKKGTRFMDRLSKGRLKAEVDHPQISNMANPTPNDLRRLFDIDETRVCCIWNSIELVSGKYRNEDGTPMIGIVGKFRPMGMYGNALQSNLDTPGADTCFSIRAFSADKVIGGKLYKTILQPVTFDWVNTPGIAAASAFATGAAMESLDSTIEVPTPEILDKNYEIPLSKADMDRYLEPTLGLGLESNLAFDPVSLYRLMGWNADPNNVPGWLKL